MGSGSSPLGGIYSSMKNTKLKNLINVKTLLKLNLQFSGDVNKVSNQYWPELKGSYNKVAIVNLQKIVLNMQIVDELFTKIILRGGSVLFLSPSKNTNPDGFNLVKHFSKKSSEDLYQGAWLGGLLTNRFKVSYGNKSLDHKLRPYLEKFDYDAIFLNGVKDSYNAALAEFQKLNYSPIVGLTNITGDLTHVDYLLAGLRYDQNKKLHVNYFFLSFISKIIVYNKLYNVNKDFSNLYYNYYTTYGWSELRKTLNSNLLNQYYLENGFFNLKKIDKNYNKYLTYTSNLKHTFYDSKNLINFIHKNYTFKHIKNKKVRNLNFNYLFLNKYLKKNKKSLIFKKNLQPKDLLNSLNNNIFNNKINVQETLVKNVNYFDKNIYNFFFFRLSSLLKNDLFLQQFHIDSAPIEIHDRFKGLESFFNKSTPLMFMEELEKRVNKRLFNLYYYINIYQYYFKRYNTFSYEVHKNKFLNSKITKKTNKKRILMYNKYAKKINYLNTSRYSNFNLKLENNSLVTKKEKRLNLTTYTRIFTSVKTVYDYYAAVNYLKGITTRSRLVKVDMTRKIIRWVQPGILYKSNKYYLSSILKKSSIIPKSSNVGLVNSVFTRTVTPKMTRKNNSIYYLLGNLDISKAVRAKILKKYKRPSTKAFLTRRKNKIRRNVVRIFKKRRLFRRTFKVLSYIYNTLYYVSSKKSNKKIFSIKSGDVTRLKYYLIHYKLDNIKELEYFLNKVKKYFIKSNTNNKGHIKLFNYFIYKYLRYSTINSSPFKKTFSQKLSSKTDRFKNDYIYNSMKKYNKSLILFKKFYIFSTNQNVSGTLNVSSNFKINKINSLKILQKFKNYSNKTKSYFLKDVVFNNIKNSTSLRYNSGNLTKLFFLYKTLNGGLYKKKVKKSLRTKSFVTLFKRFKYRYIKSNFGMVKIGSVPYAKIVRDFKTKNKNINLRYLKNLNKLELKKVYKNVTSAYNVRIYFSGLMRRRTIVRRFRRSYFYLSRNKMTHNFAIMPVKYAKSKVLLLPYTSYRPRFTPHNYPKKQQHVHRITGYLKNLTKTNKTIFFSGRWEVEVDRLTGDAPKLPEILKRNAFPMYDYTNRFWVTRFATAIAQLSKPFKRRNHRRFVEARSRFRKWQHKWQPILHKYPNSLIYKSQYINLSYKYNKFITRFLTSINKLKENDKALYFKGLKSVRGVSLRQLVSSYILYMFNTPEGVIKYKKQLMPLDANLNYFYNLKSLNTVFDKKKRLTNKAIFSNFYLFYLIHNIIKYLKKEKVKQISNYIILKYLLNQ